MPKVVDARGKSCPQPVIMTKQALAGEDDVIAIVDNEISQRNVSRMAEKQGFQVQMEAKADGLYIHLTRSAASQPEAVTSPASAAGALVVLIGADTLGRGDDELGGVLMRAFLHTLTEMDTLPDMIILVNSGVKLAVVGSPVLDDLRALSDAGVQVLACGTCLGHYRLKEQLAIGEISNMYSIAEALLGAGRVVRI